ncbi:MAG TPA: putative glycolipid-binding domain-containing protein [Thermoanaerobaculia bacterium]
MAEHRILWRRLDRPGHEYAGLRRDGSNWLLSGVAVFVDDKLPCRLEYAVVCNEAWATLHASVNGSVGSREVSAQVSARPDGVWLLNREPCPQVAGCTDIDLNFSPSTNLLPIRRLNLATGEEAHVRAAWLRFPGFTLEPLEQTYRRLSGRMFRYESAAGTFVAELEVGELGLPLRYGDIWSADAVL